VRRLFNWSVEEGLLEESPVKSIHFKPPIQPYSIEELKRFLAVCELDIRTGTPFIGLRNKAVLLLFVDTTLRSSELAQLGLTDLSLEQKWVRVISKGNKVGYARFQPLGGWLDTLPACSLSHRLGGGTALYFLSWLLLSGPCQGRH